MIQEDYVSFETAELLKEKGFDEICEYVYGVPNVDRGYILRKFFKPIQNAELIDDAYTAPTLQTAMKWLREVHNVFLVVDYDYECTDTSYCYKIYRLGEHGKPERVAYYGVSYDKNDNLTTNLVGWRDYERSYSDYSTYEEACEAAIKYCLENLI